MTDPAPDPGVLARRLDETFGPLGTPDARRPGVTEAAMAAALETRRALALDPQLAQDVELAEARARAARQAHHLGVRLTTTVREIMRKALREKDSEPWPAICRLRSELQAVLELVEPSERQTL